jgi:hypothetical protein
MLLGISDSLPLVSRGYGLDDDAWVRLSRVDQCHRPIAIVSIPFAVMVRCAGMRPPRSQTHAIVAAPSMPNLSASAVFGRAYSGGGWPDSQTRRKKPAIAVWQLAREDATTAR